MGARDRSYDSRYSFSLSLFSVISFVSVYLLVYLDACIGIHSTVSLFVHQSVSLFSINIVLMTSVVLSVYLSIFCLSFPFIFWLKICLSIFLYFWQKISFCLLRSCLSFDKCFVSQSFSISLPLFFYHYISYAFAKTCFYEKLSVNRRIIVLSTDWTL